MSSKDENFLFQLLKNIIYAVVIGSIFYYGGYGWSLPFTKDPEIRTKSGNRNLNILLFEILFVISMIIIDLYANKPRPFRASFIINCLIFILIHGLISLIGCIFYFFWRLFWPSSKNDSSDNESNTLTELTDSSRQAYLSLLRIQNNLNQETAIYVENRQTEFDMQQLEIRIKMLTIIKKILTDYADDLNLDEDYVNILENSDELSNEAIYTISKDLMNRVNEVITNKSK